MNEKYIHKTLKSEILNTLKEAGIAVRGVLLFGSRARQESTNQSDYDFLIITEKTFDFKEKMAIAKLVRTKLAKYAIDVIIKSESEIKRFKNQIGNIVGTALKEGIRL
jgi:predicted nucleotidyltransferase